MPKNVVSGMLRQGLYTRVVGRRIVYFQRLGSTMDEAACQALDGAEEGTVILSEDQTAGRGRFQRAWFSQPGNLHLSIVLRPSLYALQYLSIVSGVAVVRAIRKTTGLVPTIKWPNDVRICGKKVSGVLVENALQDNSVQYAIVGIGINVALDPSTVDGLADIATSLNIETSTTNDRETLLRHLCQEMDALYLPLRQFEGGNFMERRPHVSIMDEWRGHLDTLGKQVEVRWQSEVYTGCAEDVDEVGNLLLWLEDGTVATLQAGEVTSGLSLAQSKE